MHHDAYNGMFKVYNYVVVKVAQIGIACIRMYLGRNSCPESCVVLVRPTHPPSIEDDGVRVFLSRRDRPYCQFFCANEALIRSRSKLRWFGLCTKYRETPSPPSKGEILWGLQPSTERNSVMAKRYELR